MIMSKDKTVNPFKSNAFSRRAVLRGTGCAMALPWLESRNVWGDSPKRDKPASEAPVRLAAGL